MSKAEPCVMDRRVAYAEVVALKKNGMSNGQIAEALGRSTRWVLNVINDPNGSKQKARRERYRGTCEDCGKKTDGSSGYNAPRFCASCNGKRGRVWTRQSLIDAVQRWAKQHGRPPLATEWMRADHEGNFPAATTCYRSITHQGAPFEKWADLIEAAGFRRPLVGVYGERESWNRERIIEAIQRWAQENGKVPTMDEWRNAEHGRPTASCARAHFGSWANAVEAAGFPRPYIGGGYKTAA